VNVDTVRAGLSSGAVAGVSLLLAGAVAWLAGVPALFPSLGPTAYVLAVRSDAPSARPGRVVSGHAFGVVAGLAAHRLVTPADVSLAALPAAGSVPGARLAAAGVLAVALTTAGMVATWSTRRPAPPRSSSRSAC